MAFPTSPTTESANLVRQKTFMINRNAGIFYALKALFLHLACNQGNPDLRLVNIDPYTNASDGTNSDDQVLCDGPCKLYAMYLKKGTGSTANYIKLTNHAATGATDGTGDLDFRSTTALAEHLTIHPKGYALSTGLVMSQNTAPTGATNSLLINCVGGFVIIGQA
jgi:hypothetical protein